MEKYYNLLFVVAVAAITACSAPPKQEEKQSEQAEAIEAPEPEPKKEAPKPKASASKPRKAEVFAISPEAIRMAYSEATGVASNAGNLTGGQTLDFLIPVTAGVDMDVTLTCANEQATFMVYTMDGKELLPMPSTMWFGASKEGGELLLKLSLPEGEESVAYTLEAQAL